MSAENTPPPPPSLVLLFKAPRPFDEPAVRAAAERAFGATFAFETGGQRYVVPLAQPGGASPGPPRYAVSYTEYMLGVAQGSQAYRSDPAFDTDQPGREPLDLEPPARRAVAAHQGWVAVDGLGLADRRDTLVPPDRRDDVYRVMARLTLELFNLAERDCVALLVPEVRRVYPNDEDGWAGASGTHTSPAAVQAGPGTVSSIREVLSAKEPALLLGITGPAELEGGAPRVPDAVEEARRRLPEFLKVWEARGRAQGQDQDQGAGSGAEGGPFWVKAAFSDSHGSEQMWVAVTSIRDGLVTGTLQSDPRFVKSVRQGQKVEFMLEEAADFHYHDDRATTGALTDRVIRDIMDGRR